MPMKYTPKVIYKAIERQTIEREKRDKEQVEKSVRRLATGRDAP
jgi:hypothetical protein